MSAAIHGDGRGSSLFCDGSGSVDHMLHIAEPNPYCIAEFLVVGTSWWFEVLFFATGVVQDEGEVQWFMICGCRYRKISTTVVCVHLLKSTLMT